MVCPRLLADYLVSPITCLPRLLARTYGHFFAQKPSMSSKTIPTENAKITGAPFEYTSNTNTVAAGGPNSKKSSLLALMRNWPHQIHVAMAATNNPAENQNARPSSPPRRKDPQTPQINSNVARIRDTQTSFARRLLGISWTNDADANRRPAPSVNCVHRIRSRTPTQKSRSHAGPSSRKPDLPEILHPTCRE